MDSNLQHGFEKMKQSEKAELIYRRNEVLKRQGRRTDLNPDDLAKSVDEEFNLSRSSIQRYLRIYQLTDKLKEALDNGKIGVKVAVDLSFISTIYQDLIADYIKEAANRNGEDVVRDTSDTGKEDENAVDSTAEGTESTQSDATKADATAADTQQPQMSTIVITATGDCSLGNYQEQSYDGSFNSYYDS